MPLIPQGRDGRRHALRGSIAIVVLALVWGISTYVAADPGSIGNAVIVALAVVAVGELVLLTFIGLRSSRKNRGAIDR